MLRGTNDLQKEAIKINPKVSSHFFGNPTVPCMWDRIFCKSLSCTACRAGCCVGRDGAGGGTVGVAVAGRGVVVPDEEAEEVLLGPGEDCTLVGLQYAGN